MVGDERRGPMRRSRRRAIEPPTHGIAHEELSLAWKQKLLVECRLLVTTRGTIEMRGTGGACRGDAGLAENLLDSLATMVTELGALLRAAGLQRCALHAANCNFCSPILRAERGDLRSVGGTELSLVLGGRSRVRRQDTGCELLNRTHESFAYMMFPFRRTPKASPSSKHHALCILFLQTH